MRTKSEATHLIQSFFKLVQTQFSKSIKAMRTNNARELTLTEFLQIAGTVHQFSCPHRPQQISVVERRHQHLLNVAHALMFQVQLPIHFWGECVSTATYIINRTPSPNLQNHSPYELLYGKVPDYELMKVFGCLLCSYHSCSKEQVLSTSYNMRFSWVSFWVQRIQVI